MSRLRYVALGTLAVGLAAVTLIIYSVGFGEIANLFRLANPFYLLCYLAVSFFIAVILTFKWKLILHAKEVEVPYWRLFSYRLVGYSVSYLTPTAHVGGEPVRAYLLQREGVSINAAFSSVVIDKSIELVADILFFFIGALLIINSVAVSDNMKLAILMLSLILILLAGMFIGGLLGRQSMFVSIFRFLRLHRIKRLKPIERNIGQVEKEVELFYRKEKKYFLAIIGLLLILWVLMLLEYRFALLIFGQAATPLQIFLILTGVGLAYSIPIPAAIGILELGQVSAAKVLNLASATGVALAFLVRARDLVWTALGLLFLSMYEFNFTKLSRKTKEIDKSFEKGNLFKVEK